MWISKPNKNWCHEFFHNSPPFFFFLVAEKDVVEKWITTEYETAIAFIAGYIDAEGSFGVYNKRAKFRVGSYDKGILKQINNWLKQNQIKSILELERKKKLGKNKNFWRITVNEARSLLILNRLLHRRIKHRKDWLISKKLSKTLI